MSEDFNLAQRRALALAAARLRMQSGAQPSSATASDARARLMQTIPAGVDVPPQMPTPRLGSSQDIAGQVPGHVGGMAGAATDGLLLGAGDEYLAALSTVLGVTPDGDAGANWFDYSEPARERFMGALEQIRAEQRAYQEDSPGRAIGAEIAGAVVPALIPGGQIAAARAGTTGARMVTGMAGGAAMAGAYGFNEGEGGFGPRLQSGASAAPVGAGMGVAGALAGHQLQSFLNRRSGNAAVRRAGANAPSTEELRAAGNALYQQVDDAGIAVTPQAYRTMSDRLTAELSENGLDNTTGSLGLTPNAARLSQLLREAGEGADGIPLSEIQRLRRQAQIPAGNAANRTEAALGNRVIETLDGFMDNLEPGQVFSGNGDTAALLGDARNVWGRMRRSELLEEVIDRAQNYRSGPEAGLRAGFQSLLNNRRLMRGFSEGEISAMRRVVNSRDFNTILRQMGRFGLATTGGSSGLGAALGAASGGIVGGPVGAVATTGGATMARLASERATNRLAVLARNVAANGGLPQLPVVGIAPRNALEALTRRGGVAAANQR
jgi:hypothetical protein